MRKIICKHVSCKIICIYCFFVVAESFSLASVKVTLVLRLKTKSFSTIKPVTWKNLNGYMKHREIPYIINIITRYLVIINTDVTVKHSEQETDQSF